MKRLRGFLFWTIALLILAAMVPLLYIEGGCRASIQGYDPKLGHKSVLPLDERRPEAQSWLTYPEWHIVYSADSMGRHLAKAPPSAYSYLRDIGAFWSSYCTVNQLTGDMRGASEYKLMIYTIGLSFSAEMLVKAAYENTVGRLFEWIGGWRSQDDRYAAAVQQRYGAFMHQTPWYRFPFGQAFSGLWDTSGKGAHIRHWERRFALSAEYGVKTGYAKLVDAATGATLGRDQLTLRLVVKASPGQVAAADSRLKVVRPLADGRLVVEAPRYAAFTDIVAALAARNVPIDEIAGNDDIFLTFVGSKPFETSQGVGLFSQQLGGRSGEVRTGVSTKVSGLPALLADAGRTGIRLEHVYDY